MPAEKVTERRKVAGAAVCLILLAEIIARRSTAAETQISVDCHSDPEHILVEVHTDEPFEGLVYVSDRYTDPECAVRGTNNRTTILRVPLRGCSTQQKESGLFLSRVTVQQRPLIVSAGDGEYQVGCKLFQGDIRVRSGNDIDISGSDRDEGPPATSPSPGPEVLLRIYDFENDAFVDAVKLGQVVELEVTIRDGRKYRGSVSDCDAYNQNGTRFPVVRNFCPVDLSVSDKVYVDDQSRTTGDYYLYIPFRVFRFLDGTTVRFACNVVVCQHDCPWADCGDYLGMSYGRKRRAAPEDGSRTTLTVTNEVTVVDEDHRIPRASGTGIVEEELPPPKVPSQQNSSQEGASSLPLEYLIGGAALVLSLAVSVCVNIYLLLFIRKKMGDSEDSESISPVPTPFVENPYDLYTPQLEWKFESREILYPPMPIRHARTNRRSHSFRY